MNLLSIFLLICAIIFACLYFVKRSNLAELRKTYSYEHKILAALNKNDDLESISNVIIEKSLHEFGFDYCVVSIVDEVRELIKSEYCDTKDPLKVDPKSWINKSVYKLSGKDILVDVVNSHTILPNKNYEPQYNLEIYNSYDHKNLERKFFPITILENNNKQTLGVVEVGYLRKKRLIFNESIIKRFYLFLNQYALYFEKATRIIRRKNEIERIIRDNLKYDNSYEYIYHILRDCSNVIEPSYCFIIRDSLNSEGIFKEKDKIFIYENNELREINLPIDLFISDNYYVQIIKEKEPILLNENRISNDSDFKSLIYLPIKCQNQEVIGVMGFFSLKKDFFTPPKANFCLGVCNHIAESILRRNLNDSIKKNINPFDFFGSEKNRYEKICNGINDYFSANLVGIWKKEFTSDQCSIIYATNELKYYLEESGLDTLEVENFIAVQKYWLVNNMKDKESIIPHTFTSKYKIKSIIFLKITTRSSEKLFITIFSKRYIKSLFQEDITFLKYLNSSISLTVQTVSLINFFMGITGDIDDRDDVLDSITNNAKNLLDTSLVVLYTFSENSSLHVSYAGNLKNKNNLAQNTSNFILLDSLKEKKEPLFFNTHNDFLQFVKKEMPTYIEKYTLSGFWVKEEIKSSAVLKLKYKGNDLGVMFFNYRNEVTFSNEDKRHIMAFSFLATNAILKSQAIHENKLVLENNIKLSSSIVESLIFQSLGHDSGNLMDSVSIRYSQLKNILEKETGLDRLKDEVTNLGKPIHLLTLEFQKLKDYRKNSLDTNTENVNIASLVEESLSLLQSKIENKNIQVEKKYSFEPNVSCRPNQIKHVLLNLIINSIDALKSKTYKKEIRVAIDRDRKGKFCIISIRDNGPGISPEDRGKIFDYYYTTKTNGTGFGLPISKRMIQEHNGMIDFRSDKKSTIFTIKLPLEN